MLLIRTLAARLFWSALTILAALLLIVPLNAIVRAAPYLSLLGDPADPLDVGLRRWPLLLANTLLVAGMAALVALGGGTLLGACTARFSFRLRGWLRSLLHIAACVPAFVSATVVFAIAPPWALKPYAFTAGFCYGLFLTPLAAILVDAALRQSDRSLHEQALLDTQPIRAFFLADLPAIRGTCVALAIFVATLVATDCTFTDLLRVRTFAEEVYTQFALRRSPAGPLLTGLPIILSCMVLLLIGRARWEVFGIAGQHALDSAAPPMQMTRRLDLLVSAPVIVLSAALAIPVASLVAKTQSIGHFFRSLSGFHRELLNSTLFGLLAAFVLVIAGIGLAAAIVRMRRMGWVAAAAIAFLLALPAPVAGISLIDLVNHPGWRGEIYDSPAIVVIGYFVRFLPVAIVLLLPAVERVDREFDGQVRLDGGGLSTLLWSIARPLLVHEIACAFLILFLLCFAEVPCTILVCPPGFELASVRAFSLLHFGVYADWAALAIAAGLISLSVAGLLRWIAHRADRGG